VTERRIEHIILAFSLIVVVIIGVGSSLDVVWRSSFEVQDVSLESYTASDWQPDRGTPKNLQGKTHAFIDPDGEIVTKAIGADYDQTGLHVAIGIPAPVNYEQGQYRQVYTTGQWRPTEEWEVEIDGFVHQISVYRMICGITITTATSRPDKGIYEYKPIRNLQIKVRVNLPVWKGVEGGKVGMGMIYIPKSGEVVGTPWSPPVKTELIDYEDKRYFFGLFPAISFNQDPYISPQVPGTVLYGSEVSSTTTVVGAPTWVIIPFEWASIKPGIQDIGLFKEARAEVSEAINFVIIFMADRPLYAVAAEPGVEPAVGGRVQPPPSCGLLEQEVRDSEGVVIACQKIDIWGDILKLLLLVVIVVIGGLVVYGLIKWAIIGAVRGK